MKIANRDKVREVLKVLQIPALKKFGQNFLIDEQVASNIVSLLELKANESVVEIGPGLGALTHYIVNEGVNLKAVEIDRTLTEFLINTYESSENVEIINEDFLKLEFSNGKKVKVIGNLPYYITTPIMEKLIKNSDHITRLVVMVQSEVVKRFNAVANEAEYGALSVLLSLIGKGRGEFKVSNTNFFPRPNVASQIYVFDFNHNFSNDYIDELFRFVTALFTNKRKSIVKSLEIVLGNRRKAKNIIDKVNIESNLRAENIIPETYKQMFDLVLEEDLLKTVTYPRPKKRNKK